MNELEEKRITALDALLWLMDNSQKTKNDEIPNNLGNDIRSYVNAQTKIINLGNDILSYVNAQTKRINALEAKLAEIESLPNLTHETHPDLCALIEEAILEQAEPESPEVSRAEFSEYANSLPAPTTQSQAEPTLEEAIRIHPPTTESEGEL